MLNFDEPRFLAIQSGAVGLADRIHKVIADALDGGAVNLFLPAVAAHRPGGDGRPR
jgi:fructoselysine-6-phosphate deglycase